MDCTTQSLATEPDDRISIPSLNIDVPLVKPQLGLDSLKSQDWNALEEQIRSSLQKGVVYYQERQNQELEVSLLPVTVPISFGSLANTTLFSHFFQKFKMVPIFT